MRMWRIWIMLISRCPINEKENFNETRKMKYKLFLYIIYNWADWDCCWSTGSIAIARFIIIININKIGIWKYIRPEAHCVGWYDCVGGVEVVALCSSDFMIISVQYRDKFRWEGRAYLSTPVDRPWPPWWRQGETSTYIFTPWIFFNNEPPWVFIQLTSVLSSVPSLVYDLIINRYQISQRTHQRMSSRTFLCKSTWTFFLSVSTCYNGWCFRYIASVESEIFFNL